MNLETRIDSLLEDLLYCGLGATDIDKVKGYIRNALDIQAIETQSACFEAIRNCPCNCIDAVGRRGIYPEDALTACANIMNV